MDTLDLPMTMRGAATEHGVSVSVVIAMFNEAENVDTVLREAVAAFEGTDCEIVIVDDGSTDGTHARACAASRFLADVGAVRVLRHDRRCGKTAALRTGVRESGARWVVTMDGDGQNDPADARRLTEVLRDNPASLIAGVRQRRVDASSRRIATRIANGFRQRVLRDGCPDTGCGLKAFSRENFLMLPQFEGMHRFLPALFATYGLPVVCVPVGHRARHTGQSKYTNWGRALVGLVDLIGVIWLRSRTHVPGRVTGT